MSKGVLTDNRILFLLRCGEQFESIIDPEGLLQKGSPKNLCFSVDQNGNLFGWKLEVSFESGDVLILNGRYENSFVLTGVLFFSGNGKPVKLSAGNFSSLMDSFGDLSLLPVRLKQNLSFVGHSSYNISDNSFNLCLPSLVSDALFFSVEGGAVLDGNRSSFREFCLSFIYSPEGHVVRTDIFGRAVLSGSVIMVSMSADYYGLGKKVVTYERSFLSDGSFSASCVRKENGKNVPSINIALMLDKILSDNVSAGQKVIRKSVGKPTSK